MGQYETERILTLLYSVSACLAIITLSSTAAAWTHWSEILDTCMNRHCGCILYGSSTYSFFRGGSTSLCHFATFASVPVLIISIVLAVYHGYRVCIVTRRNKSKVPHRHRRRSGDVVVITSPNEQALAGNDPGCACWIPLATLAAVVTVLLLVNAVILIDGYYKTCDEYSKTLVKSIKAMNQVAAVIYGRLSCGAILDFMDYLEPVTRPFHSREDERRNPFEEERDFYRGDFINTGLSLQIAIAAAWINVIIWITTVVYNSIMARSSRSSACCCCKSS